MATWIIGDVQGCFDGMMGALNAANFDVERDHLWSVGDLINRGHQSLEVLQFCHQLGERFMCTLGNHDLHFLAVAQGCSQARNKDTFDDLLAAKNVTILLHWLQQQPIAHYDKQRKLLLCHAGVAPMWTLNQTLGYASEIEQLLRSDQKQLTMRFFKAMYGNDPNCWNDQLQQEQRWRTITNYFTRMRFINRAGAMNMALNKGVEEGDENWRPWFQLPHKLLDAGKVTLAIGHWAALNGETHRHNLQALDTGYVWGGPMTMLNADTFEKVSYNHG